MASWWNRLRRVTDPEAGSNCYLLPGKEACLVIDPNDFTEIGRILKQWDAGRVLALLTHEHCDHILGLNRLRNAYPTEVVASAACSRGIGSRKLNMSGMMEVFLFYKTGRLVRYQPFTCEPAQRQFERRLSLSWEDYEIDMELAPGHTPGSSIIRLGPAGAGREEQLVFSGDYMIPGEPVNTRLFGGSKAAYEAGTRKLLAGIADGTWVFPGHGEPFVMRDEVRRAL